MHEFAIAESIKEIVKDSIAPYQEKYPKLEVEYVKVHCGVLNQIVPSVLEEAFRAIIQDDAPMQNTQLKISLIDATLLCLSCNKEYTRSNKEDIFLPCPYCNSVASHKLLGGKEMLIDHIEIQIFED